MYLVLLILICWTIMFAWSRLTTRHPSPPVYPGALPLIGHAHLLIGDGKYLWTLEKKVINYCIGKGGVIKAWICLHPWYVLTDPDDSLIVANTCLDKPYLYDFGKDMYNNGLATSKVGTWKIHRKLLNLSFNQQVLNTFMNEFNVQAQYLLSQLDAEVGKGEFDVERYLVKNLLRTVCRTSLGLKTEDQNMIDKDYVLATENYIRSIVERIQTIWLHLPFIFNRSSIKIKQDKLIKTLKGIMNEVIIKRKSELKANNSSNNGNDSTADTFKPLLNQMLYLANSQDAFNDEEIREHLDTFVLATFGTGSLVMTFALLLIGSNQDVQERVYKELREVFGNQDRDVNQHDLMKLVYLEAVLKEALRLYPPGPIIARNIDRDVKLKNYTLPAGSTCLIALYGINRHPMWGADAGQFRPERWLDPTTLPGNPNAFASFSLGRRNCIGKLYSMMAMKTTLAHICRRYHITGDINKVLLECDMVAKPVSGHHISLKLRT